MQSHPFIDNLIRQAEEQPLMALASAAALITSLSKLVEASGRRQSTLAYARAEARRHKAAKKK